MAGLQWALHLLKGFVCNSGRLVSKMLFGKTASNSSSSSCSSLSQAPSHPGSAPPSSSTKRCFQILHCPWFPPTPVCSRKGEATQEGSQHLSITQEGSQHLSCFPKSGLPYCRHPPLTASYARKQNQVWPRGENLGANSQYSQASAHTQCPTSKSR